MEGSCFVFFRKKDGRYRERVKPRYHIVDVFIVCLYLLGMSYASSGKDEVCGKYDEENTDGCFCVTRPSSLVPGGYGQRITSQALKNKNTFPTDLPKTTIQLDLSNNGVIGELQAASLSNLQYLQKLDLQGNEISSFEDKAFQFTPHLEVLDLSRNRLGIIQQNTFRGLENLEKLKLNDNQIQRIEKGSFDHLLNLEKLDLSDNTFVCDCSLEWFIRWIETKGEKLIANPSKLKCALPIRFADRHLRKLKSEDMGCGQNNEKGDSIDILPGDTTRENGKGRTIKIQQGNQVGMLEILPNHHQTVFGGDSFKLSCKAELTNFQKVSIHNGSISS